MCIYIYIYAYIYIYTFVCRYVTPDSNPSNDWQRIITAGIAKNSVV